MSTSHSVIVIGGGISGLACAYSLKKSGHDVLLLESSANPGGMIHSVLEKGFLFETGPQSFSNTHALNKLIEVLGIANELVIAPSHAPRYVLVNGKLKPVPLSPGAFLGSSLLKWSTKFSLLREPFRKFFPPQDDESVADFVRRKFKPELLELLVGPFVSGIYAGDPERLSLRAAFPMLHEAEKAAGSIIRGLKAVAKKRSEPRKKPTLASFRNGNETLIRALAEALGDSLQTNARVKKIGRGADQQFEISVIRDAGSAQFLTSQLVLATPSESAASLLEGLLPNAASALSQIEYAPVAVVSLGYSLADVSHPLDGFGFLIPRSAGLKTLGTVWNSSLFPGRAAGHCVLFTSFLGGATDPATASLPDDSLIELVSKELDPVLGLMKGPHPFISRVTRYSHAIPQYNLGHLDRLAIIQSDIAKIPGLYLTGNYFHGPAIGTCIEHAQSVAESIRIG